MTYPSTTTYPDPTQTHPRARVSDDAHNAEDGRAGLAAKLNSLKIKNHAHLEQLLGDEWVTEIILDAWMNYVSTQGWIKDPVAFTISKLLAHQTPPNLVAVQAVMAKASNSINREVYERLLALSNNRVLSEQLAGDNWVTLPMIDGWMAYAESQEWMTSPVGFIIQRLRLHIAPPEPPSLDFSTNSYAPGLGGQHRVNPTSEPTPDAEVNSELVELLKHHHINAVEELSADSWITPAKVEAWVEEAKEKLARKKIRSIQGYVVMKLRSHEEPPDELLKEARRTIQRRIASESWLTANITAPEEQTELAEALVDAGVTAPNVVEFLADPWVTWSKVMGWLWEIGFNDITEDYPEGELVAMLRSHYDPMVEC